ncbi:MAG: 30S ribosomal protein S20 [Candidatus Neomarinimicrobiota bacterium]
MDRHAQQFKRERQDKARGEINSHNRSKLRTLIKKVLATKNQKEAEGYYKDTVSFIDKMAAKNLIHKNTAGRRKALITRHLNSITK